MKKLYRSSVILFCFLFCQLNFSFAQRVYPLVSGVSVDSVFEVKPSATKLDQDPITGNLFYSTLAGDIYEIFMPNQGTTTDSLRFTSADHGITFLQGLCFHDSTLFLCGNVWSSTTAIGKVVKGVLNANGTRTWSDVFTTAPYPSANSSGDHGFAGVAIDPSGTYIYVSSGARTHLGEIRTNGGAWPGKREVPFTSRIFRFPINTVGLTLPNDSNIIDNSGYVYAWGTRNAYDMAWDSNDTLFAIDNSGERDDPEELNWLRQGKHYGYPWRMGGNDNPLRNSPYDVNADPLVNHLSGGYLSGWFADDPTFPSVPSGITFTDPIRNYGDVADFYRDPISGSVKNASDEGTFITTFTPHRSPLGLIIDRDSALAAPFSGDAFVLSFMPGGDSTGFTPLSPWGSPCPFVDPSRELVQMKIMYDSGIDNYKITTSNVVEGFYLPVDAELVGSDMYVIENGGDLWKISFPSNVNVQEIEKDKGLTIYPKPLHDKAVIKLNSNDKKNLSVRIFNCFGQLVKSFDNFDSNTLELNRDNLVDGFYIAQIADEYTVIGNVKFVVR